MNDDMTLKVIVDSSTTIEIKLKREMTAIEFMGLTTKAKKIFNISEVEMPGIDSRDIERPQHLTTNIVKKTRGTYNTSRVTWTEEMKKYLADNYGKKSIREMADTLQKKFDPNVSKNKIQVQLTTLRIDGRIK